MMTRSVQQKQVLVPRRFTLRTLFFISAVVAVPFLLLANMRHSQRPEESVASPLYLLFGIAAVVLAAAIGSALGSRTGMYAGAGLAALCWIALVLIGCLFADELKVVLPAHVLCCATTMIILAVVSRPRKDSAEDGPHGNLLRLLSVKHNVREAQQAKASGLTDRISTDTSEE